MSDMEITHADSLSPVVGRTCQQCVFCIRGSEKRNGETQTILCQVIDPKGVEFCVEYASHCTLFKPRSLWVRGSEEPILEKEPEANAKSAAFLHTRITQLVVSGLNAPLYDDSSTIVSVEDDGGGEYVTVEQPAEDGKIKINPEEWTALRSAIDQIVNLCRK